MEIFGFNSFEMETEMILKACKNRYLLYHKVLFYFYQLNSNQYAWNLSDA